MKDIDKIYIIHYTKLGARKTHMQTQMETWFPDISHEFVEDFDQEKLSNDIISDNFDLETFDASLIFLSFQLLRCRWRQRWRRSWSTKSGSVG